jgi:hypothetical protein
MGVQGRQAEGHNLQVVLDQLHAGPVRNNKAPYWVVDQSANHDEDRQVMKGRKAAAPFVSKYKDQIEAREQRHPSDRQEESESAVPSGGKAGDPIFVSEDMAKDELGNICVGNIKEEKR